MKTALAFLCALELLLLCPICVSSAQDTNTIALPAPETSGGMPFMETIRQRQTLREIKRDRLPPRLLSNLLWAAFGINRPETAHRTAPSAMNSQELDIYVAMQEGLYLYEPKPNQLRLVASRDIRAKTSGQAFGTNAPVTLLFVADLSRLAKARPETKLLYANFDAGCISQNVYLYCASAGLATVVHDLDRAPLRPLLGLRPEQEIIMAQAVGYPAPAR